MHSIDLSNLDAKLNDNVINGDTIIPIIWPSYLQWRDVNPANDFVRELIESGNESYVRDGEGI